ncbi:MAG TPA: thioredoxin domain-containing protein [Gemmatimonadaceae bacterium]|nr:thioredoxin domain-containing protein [Gemmatimonadaceae bacterium]
MTHLTFRAVAAVLTLAACKPSPTNSSAPSDSARLAEQPTSPAAAAPDTATKPQFARADSARITGADSAHIWVIEVSDFQCPFCAEWHRTVWSDFRKEFVESGRVRFAYVNMPLSSHRNAWPAAETAMCAAVQGKFWPVHDALFASQDRWAPLRDPNPVLDSLAAAAGVEMDTYRACRAGHDMRPLIQADYDRAVAASVRSTPSFIIGGTILSGVQPLAELRRAIASASSQPH